MIKDICLPLSLISMVDLRDKEYLVNISKQLIDENFSKLSAVADH